MTLEDTAKQAANLLQGAPVDLVESVYAPIQLDNLTLTSFYFLSISSAGNTSSFPGSIQMVLC